MVEMSWWTSNRASEWGQRGDSESSGCWCQTGWSEYYRNWLSGISTTQPFLEFTENYLKKKRWRESIQWAAVDITRYKTISECTSTLATEDHTGCHSFQLRTENWGYSLHRLIKSGLENTSVLTSQVLLLCSDCRVKTFVNKLKAWIPPALYQQFRLLVV